MSAPVSSKFVGNLFESYNHNEEEVDCPRQLSNSRHAVRRRMLKRKRLGYRRRKPRTRGRKARSRFIQPYTTIGVPPMRQRFHFLHNYTYISSLNKAFIRSLKVKITHYRLTRREFFSQYLIRLNPRHILYKTINYQHLFTSPLSVQIMSRLERRGTLEPTLTNVARYIEAKQLLQNYSFGSFDFRLRGVFTFLNLLQTSVPVDGYRNMTRRKRALLRRR